MKLSRLPTVRQDEMQFLEGAGQRKTLAPFLNIEEGTRVVCKCYTRGATPIVFQSLKRKTTFCWLLYCVGTAHLFLLAAVQGMLLYLGSRLSSVSRSRRRFEKEGSIPNFHSVSDRCWVPLSYSVRSTRVSVYDFVCIKHTS